MCLHTYVCADSNWIWVSCRVHCTQGRTDCLVVCFVVVVVVVVVVGLGGCL